MSLVVDSSATLAWIYADETTAAIRQVFDRVADEGAVVPLLRRLGVADGLTVAVRRQRIDAEFRHAALADLALWDIAVDQHTDARAWGETLRLADQFWLTSHDGGLSLGHRDGHLKTASPPWQAISPHAPHVHLTQCPPHREACCASVWLGTGHLEPSAQIHGEWTI